MNHLAIIRTLVVILALLIGVIVGLVAGIIARIGGSSLAAATREGGIAFGATVTLTFLIMSSLGLL